MDDVSAPSAPIAGSVDYDAERNVYRGTFDQRGGSASETVVSVLATASGNDPLDLEPLYSVVDPDALDELVASSVSSHARGDTSVRFTANGYDVTVDDRGTVVVEPPDEAER